MPEHTATTNHPAPPRQPWVHEAVVEIAADTDPRALGGAVTTALCGHWEHDGPCRWPHNNDLEGRTFRTLFVCEPADEPEVRARIRAALLEGAGWRVLSDRARPVTDAEWPLARNLMSVPRRE